MGLLGLLMLRMISYIKCVGVEKKMTKINIDPNEVKKIEEKLLVMAKELAQISSGNYIIESPFDKSQGNSVDCINDFLHILVQCSNQMEDIFFNTCRYLDAVIEQFTFVEDNYTRVFKKNQKQEIR